MGISKTQKAGVVVTCKCGCNTQFTAFPVYDQGKGKGLRTPEYKRGHHPNCKKSKPAWNKGLKKGDHPSIERMGCQAGKKHWNYNPAQHPDWFADNFDFVDFTKKFGVKPRSKGGNKAYTRFRLAIINRDNYTCQNCGMVADPFEELDLLNVHHIVFVKHDKTRIFDPSNVVTLCFACHRKIHRTNK